MRKNITVEFTNERIIPSGGLAVVGAILGKNDFVKRCNRMKVDCNHPQHQIKNGDIMLTYIGMQCMGKPSFEAVHEMDDHPDFYKDALGICYAIPSSEPLRQRFDLIGSSIRRQVLDENIHMLKSNGIVPSKLPCGYVPVDMDVSPFDNSKTSKEGVSRTYKGGDAIFTGNGGTLCRKPRCHFHLSRIIISKYDLRLGSRIQDNIKIV